MKAEIVTLLVFFGGLAIVGRLDQQSGEIGHKTAMEAPRPVFEPVHQARKLSMPCTYLQSKHFDHEPVSARNTRCVDADRSE